MKRTLYRKLLISLPNTCAQAALGLACAALLIGNPFPGIPAPGNLGGGQEIQIPEGGEQPGDEPGISPQHDRPDYVEPEI